MLQRTLLSLIVVAVMLLSGVLGVDWRGRLPAFEIDAAPIGHAANEVVRTTRNMLREAQQGFDTCWVDRPATLPPPEIESPEDSRVVYPRFEFPSAKTLIVRAYQV